MLCPSNPHDPGWTRGWEAPAVAAWFVQAAINNVDAEPLPDEPPPPALHLVHSHGRRYALIATDDHCSTEITVQAIPEHHLHNPEQHQPASTDHPPF